MRLPVDRMVLGQLISSRRTAQSLSQGELARLLGCHGQFVSNWERGLSDPPEEMLIKICAWFGITESELTSAVIPKAQEEISRIMKRVQRTPMRTRKQDRRSE